MNAPSPWELASEDVLSIMYADADARDLALYDLQLRAAHFPTPRTAALFNALATLHGRGETPHDTLILDMGGSVITLDWLAQVVTLSDESRRRAFRANVALVRKHGLTAGAKRLLALATEQLDSGQPLAQVTGNLLTVLTGLDKSATVKRETATDLADDFLTLMHSTPPALLLTGIDWLDGLTGGMDRGHLWWIAAPYKSRKSTVMLNIALGLLMTWVTQGCVGEPPSIGIASGEMPRPRIAATFVSMIACAYLKRAGLWHESFAVQNRTYPLHMLSPKMLLDARANYRRWDTRRVAAVDYGIAQFRQFESALRVYDRTPDGGSLADIKQLTTILRRDMHRYKTSAFMIDYLQIFKGVQDAKLYDYVANASLELQKFAQSEGVTLVILAQQNEETIKSGASYSAGIKGGGDPAATADYLITSRYKSGDVTADNELELTMKLSRHGSGGGEVQKVLEIHPASGLLLESKWIGRLAL